VNERCISGRTMSARGELKRLLVVAFAKMHSYLICCKAASTFNVYGLQSYVRVLDVKDMADLSPD
jgi:hypothetical protein